MGLDWIVFQYVDGEELAVSDGYYRGKGVAYDKNIKKLDDNDTFKNVCNSCFGDETNTRKTKGDDGEEETRNWIMTPEQKQLVESAIQHVLDLPKEQIHTDTDEERYEEWREWMEGALKFLKSVDYDKDYYIWCWW